jgi:hypothetical protein
VVDVRRVVIYMGLTISNNDVVCEYLAGPALHLIHFKPIQS